MFNLIAVFFLLISIGSFTFATIRAIQALNIRPYFLNEFSYFITDDTIKVNLKLSETETLTQFIKKKSANDKTITETSNYVYASFILVRNGIICFTLFFVFAIIDKSLSASLRKSRVDNSSITIDKNFKK